MTTAPPQAKRKLKWTEFVPLFGIPRDPNETFIVCLTKQELSRERRAELARLCNEKLGLEPGTVTEYSSYGGYAFELPFRLKDRAYELMDTLLHAGVDIFTQNRMPVNITAADLPLDQVLTPEWLDRHHALNKRRDIFYAAQHYHDNNLSSAVDSATFVNKFVFSHEASWITEEGRELVRWLRQLYYSLQTDSSDEETLRPLSMSQSGTGEKRKREDSIVTDKVEPAPKQQKTEEKPVIVVLDDAKDEKEEEKCMICLEGTPDTLVLPCMHQVVCRACSEALKKTANATRCVYCRQDITGVYMDCIV